MPAIIVLLVVAGLTHAARTFYASGQEPSASTGTALAFGFLLLAAFFAGKLFSLVRLPKLTGYICCGIIAGPSVLQLLSEPMVRSLGPVKGVAVCLIALTAGGELNFGRMRPLMRTVLWITFGSVGITAFLATIALFVLRPWLPFMADITLGQSLAVCAVLAVAISAMSPAVTMALFSEVGAEGPVSRTVLGVVVVADLLVVVLFAVVSSIARSAMGGPTDVSETALHLSWELFGSLGVGAAVGGVLALYLRKVHEGRALFVLLLCVLMSEVGGRLGLDPLLVALSAGLFIENVTEIEASALVHDIESASLPVYVVFFALAGAMLDVRVFAAVAVPALVLVSVRAFGMWLGARTGARAAKAAPEIQSWAFVGLLPQAGLALALALLIPRVFPDFGEAAAALIVGIVGLNELIMPAILRWGLVRIGEAKAVTRPPAEGAATPAAHPSH